MEALNDKDERVMESAIEALGEIGDATAVLGLLELLNDVDISKVFDTKKRTELQLQYLALSKDVSNALVKIGDAAVPDLVDALHRKNWNKREKVIEILGDIGNAAAVPDLLEILREESFLRKKAIKAILKIGDAAALPGLLEALKYNDLDVRKVAVEVLMKIGDATAVPGLLEALKNDKDSIVRINVSELLGKLGDTTAVSGLLEAIKNDGDQEVLRSAARALVKLDDAAVPDLINALQDEKISTRRKGIIANSLRQIGTPEALAAFNTRYHNK